MLKQDHLCIKKPTLFCSLSNTHGGDACANTHRSLLNVEGGARSCTPVWHLSSKHTPLRPPTQVARGYGVPVVINDRVDVALACGADGVHVGQSDLPAAAVRKLLGPSKIVGVSVKSVQQALAAHAGGADYLGAGAGGGPTSCCRVAATNDMRAQRCTE